MWFNLGWARVTSEFDDDGNRVDLGRPAGLPEGVDADITSLAVNLGGLYTFYQIGDMNLNAGINFSMVQQKQTIEAPLDVEQSSGFAPQNLTIFGEIERPMYSLRLGYLLDLGPEAEAADERENSDLQNAIQFGASAQHWAGDFRLFGGADYFLTLSREIEELDMDVDLGDIANLHAGAGWNWGDGEIGVALLYRINMEGSPEPATPNREQSSGWVLGAAPYVTYSPMGGNYQLYVKGALQREYYDYGFSLAGRNDIAPRLGFTVGVNYAL